MKAVALLLAMLTVSPQEAAGWRRDLTYMAHAIVTYHKSAFHSVSPAQFSLAVNALYSQIPRLSRYQVIVRLKQIIALVGDEHTGFGLSTGAPTHFHALPVKIQKYADGFFVQSAAPEYRNIVGLRVIRIGKLPIEDVAARLRRVADTSNEWSLWAVFPFLMRIEVLQAIGAADSGDHAGLVVEDAGALRTVALRPVPVPIDLGYTYGAPPKSNWADARDPGAPPLYLADPQRFYWYKMLPDGTLYIYLKFVLNAPSGETLAQFFERAFAYAQAQNARKVVLDIRGNGGGNNTLTPAVVQNIVMRPNINSYGHLFVIIGRGTASAAQNLADRLQRDTNAIFVGEPTSEWPNHYGDPQTFILPYSRIAVHISSLFWQDMDPRDTRKWTGPDIAAELTSADYKHNIDPAMEAVRQWNDRRLTDRLEPAIAAGSEAQMKAAYAAFFADPRHKYAQTEYAIEDLGHDLIDQGKIPLAVALFRLNLETHPGSTIAYDGLGDGLIAAKDTAGARSAYTSALRINPRDAIAAAALSQL